jgi:hypothetical protein
MTTEERIEAMLKENTGRHFLDSGGETGRHWQRNQGVNFNARKPAALTVNKYGIEVALDTFSWLVSRLDYSPEADAKFQRWMKKREEQDPSLHDLELMQEYAEKWVEKYGGGHGPYGEGKEPCVVNSYNEHNLLDQTIQFTYVDPKGGNEPLVLLQIHGGADVRGGYTRPRLFTEDRNHELGIFDYARADIGCKGDHEHNWSTDDGSHWYFQGCAGRSYDDKQLDKLARLDVGEWMEEHEETDLTTALDKLALGEAEDSPLVLKFHEGKAFCPFCHNELEAGFF